MKDDQEIKRQHIKLDDSSNSLTEIPINVNSSYGDISSLAGKSSKASYFSNIFLSEWGDDVMYDTLWSWGVFAFFIFLSIAVFLFDTNNSIAPYLIGGTSIIPESVLRHFAAIGDLEISLLFLVLIGSVSTRLVLPILVLYIALWSLHLMIGIFIDSTSSFVSSMSSDANIHDNPIFVGVPSWRAMIGSFTMSFISFFFIRAHWLRFILLVFSCLIALSCIVLEREMPFNVLLGQALGWIIVIKGRAIYRTFDSEKSSIWIRVFTILGFALSINLITREHYLQTALFEVLTGIFGMVFSILFFVIAPKFVAYNQVSIYPS